MNRRTLNLLVVAMAIVTITAAAMLAFAVAQDKLPAPSMEERMVSDTDAVLGVLRTWHNQISQDQAVIKSQQQRIEGVATILPGEPGQQLRWNGKWEWFTPPPPADKPVETPGK